MAGSTNALTRRSLLLSSLAAAAPAPAQAPPRKHLLASLFPPEKLAAALTPRGKWRFFPTADDRAAWAAVPAAARDTLIDDAARQLGLPWPTLPATLFLEYRRNGNRTRYEAGRRERRNRLRDLVLAECLEAKGRFLDEIVNGVWLTVEETFWGVPAHLSLQQAGPGLPDASEPVIDLFAADTGSLLAWTSYLLGPALDRVSPLVRPRIHLEIDRRILTPYAVRDDFWWMGLDPKLTRSMNNWNPWINSNCLTCALLEEHDETRRRSLAAKALRSLDRFLDSYHQDGGCDEGPGYWGHAGGSLFECLELLHSATAGAFNAYTLPLVQEIGRYIYRAHIHGDFYVNFADASARVGINGPLVYRYGRAIGDPLLAAQGAWAARRSSAGERSSSAIARSLAALFQMEEIAKSPGQPPYVRDTWLPGTQFFTARVRAGSHEGLYLAAQGGHNAESHNHNDVGNFIVYANGEPALVDVGVENYTAKTFSSRRYEIWTMQSAYHNCPTVNGAMQGAGRAFAAQEVHYQSNDRAASLSMEIAAAYPPGAGLESWRRTLTLDRTGNRVIVEDTCALAKDGGRVEFNLMTPCRLQTAPGQVTLSGAPLTHGAVALRHDPALAAAVDEIDVTDSRLTAVWGGRLYRIRLTASNIPQQRRWTLTAAPA